MTPICIAGMHRSGTSVTAQLLHRCGINLGDESVLMAAAADNPDGFWEDTRFVAVNDAILGAFGGAWDYPPAMAHGWPEDQRLNAVRKDAEALLADCAKRPTLWGWKDPRNSLTFPFWQRYFPTMKVVFCLRNPLAIAQSLFVRSHNSYVFGLNMWYRYNIAFFHTVPPDQRIVTAYDAYFDDAQAELVRVLAFLGITVPIAVQNQALAAVSSGLRHYAYTEQDLHGAGVSATIIDLYTRLREEAVLQAGDVAPRIGITDLADRRSSTDEAKPAPLSARAQDGELVADNTIPSNLPQSLPREGVGHIDQRAVETTRLRFEVEDLRMQFASLEATYRDLEQEYLDLEHQLRGVRAEYSELTAYCGKLHRELADRHDARKETDSYIRVLEEQLAAVNVEQEKTTQYIQMVMQQMHDAKGEQERTGDYVRTLEEQLAAVEGERGRTDGYIRMLEGQLAAVTDEQVQASGYVYTLEEQLAPLKDERAGMSRYVQLLLEQFIAAEDERGRVADYVQSLEEQIAALKGEQERTGDYVRTLEEQLAAVEGERGRTDGYIRMLEGQLAAVTDEQVQASGYVYTLEEQLAASEGEQEQATDYQQTLERQLFTARRTRQEAEIRLVSLEQQLAQQRALSQPDPRP